MKRRGEAGAGIAKFRYKVGVGVRVCKSNQSVDQENGTSEKKKARRVVGGRFNGCDKVQILGARADGGGAL